MYSGPGGHLAEILVEHGVVSPGEIGRALEIQRQHHNKRFVDILIEAGIASAEALAPFLPKVGLAAPAAERGATHFADSFIHERFEKGDVIFREGELGQKAYVLLSGHVRIVNAGGGYLLATVGPGELFGELALLDGGHRTATAEAAEVCETMVLTRSEFLAQVRARPDIALDVIGLLAKRLRSADELISLLSDGVPDLS